MEEILKDLERRKREALQLGGKRYLLAGQILDGGATVWY